VDALGREPGDPPPATRPRRRPTVRPEPLVPAPRRGDLARKLRAARQQAPRPDEGR
jgi:hypothetical protein